MKAKFFASIAKYAAMITVFAAFASAGTCSVAQMYQPRVPKSLLQ